jgi:hypothetical protein
MNPNVQLMLQQALHALQVGNFEDANLILKKAIQVSLKIPRLIFIWDIAYIS